MADALTPIYGFTLPEVNVSTTWPTSLNGDVTAIENEIARPRYPFNSPTVGATTTCDLSLARTFVFTVSQATTLAFSNVPSASFFVRVILIITNGSAFVLTFPASVNWLTGGLPSLQASGVDVLELVTIDAGTTWRARLLNGGYARVGASTSTARLPRVLYQTFLRSTTSASEVSLLPSVYTLPANALDINGAALRVTVTGVETAGAAGQIRVKFGAAYFLNTTPTNNLTSNTSYWAQAMIARMSATAQRGSGVVLSGLAVTTNDNPIATETLSGTVAIDVRGFAGAGSTLNADSVTIEYLEA